MANRTDGNHIFLNFVPCISIDPVKIGGDIKAIVFKYATRLLKLQVSKDSIYLTEEHLRLQVKCAEIRCIIRTTPNATPAPHRLCLEVIVNLCCHG